MADTLIWCRTAGPQELVDNSTTTFKSLPPGLGILVECSRWVQVCENVQEVQIVQATCRRPIVTLLVAATAFSSKMHFLETWLVGYLCRTLVQDTCRIGAVKLQWLNLGPPWTTLDHLGPPWTTLDTDPSPSPQIHIPRLPSAHSSRSGFFGRFKRRSRWSGCRSELRFCRFCFERLESAENVWQMIRVYGFSMILRCSILSSNSKL